MAAAIAAAALGATQAATLTLTGLDGGGLGSSVTTNPPVFNGSTLTGALLGTLTGAPGYSLLTNVGVSGSFTFCVELGAPVSFLPNASYAVVDPGVAGQYSGWSPSVSGRLDKLLSYALPLFSAGVDKDAQTALQLAIWNRIYDIDDDLKVGAFIGTSSSAIDAKANSFLVGGTNFSGLARHFFVATSASNQDVIVVPEPGAAVLVLTALAGLAFTRRSR